MSRGGSSAGTQERKNTDKVVSERSQWDYEDDYRCDGRDDYDVQCLYHVMWRTGPFLES